MQFENWWKSENTQGVEATAAFLNALSGGAENVEANADIKYTRREGLKGQEIANPTIKKSGFSRKAAQKCIANRVGNLKYPCVKDGEFDVKLLLKDLVDQGTSHCGSISLFLC